MHKEEGALAQLLTPCFCMKFIYASILAKAGEERIALQLRPEGRSLGIFR